MEIHQIALIIAPITAVCIAFLLNKYFQNKPNLIAYRGHVSTHKMPLNVGYNIFVLKFKNKPTLAMLQRLYPTSVPLIIKHENEIWIFGEDKIGNKKLEKSDSSSLYESINFKEEISLANNISAEIYDDIIEKNAHAPYMFIGTHAIVIINTGNLPTHNVRIVHRVLTNYYVSPRVEYKEIANLSGAKDLVFPILVSKEQITISYMYFPPMVFTDVNDHIKSDEGLVRFTDVMPTVVLPTWKKILVYFLLFLGFSTIIYLTIIITTSLYRCIF